MKKIVTLCILLKEDNSKVNYMNYVFKKHKYIKFFPAIYWKTNIQKAINLFLEYNLKLKCYLSQGAFCIWLTNIQLWMRCLKKFPRKKYFIILEDDIILPNQFLKFVNNLYIKTGIVDKVGAVMLYPKKPINCVATLYTRKQIKKILHAVFSNGITNRLDDYLIVDKKFVKRPNINLANYNRKIKSRRVTSEKNKHLKNIKVLISEARIKKLEKKKDKI